jgi:hypothetical protein
MVFLFLFCLTLFLCMTILFQDLVLVSGGRVLARQIPEIISIARPATAAQIETLAASLGLELPEEYRALLTEANGVYADLVQIYPAEDVPERNATYRVAEYAPGWLLICLATPGR